MRIFPFTATVLVTGIMGLSISLVYAQDASVPPAGEEKSTKTKILELGAKTIQGSDPLSGMDIYLSGFHPIKNDPNHQLEAHHFCRQVNEDFAQCVLFDGSTPDANLNGIEYIVSERLFEQLPEEERQYWHPHNGEILSGQLIAPGLPEAAEKELMRTKMNSYGKTWHVWNTPAPGHEGDALPMGDAMLAWSFNRDGELREDLIRSRDERLDKSTAEVREAPAR